MYVVVSKIYVSITPSLSNSSRKPFTEAAQNLSLFSLYITYYS